VQIREGKIKPKWLVDLSGFHNELSYVKREGNEIKIGALTTVGELEETFLFKERKYGGFVDVFKKFANAHVRNLATIGGNVAVAVSASDFILLFKVLDAKVRLESVRGTRWINIHDLIVEKRTLAKQPDEVIIEISFSDIPSNAATAFMKFDYREVTVTGIVTVASYLKLKNGIIEDIRVAFDRVSRRIPDRVLKTEEFLKGKEFNEEVIKAANNNVLVKEMKRKTDFRASGEYRLHLSKVLLKRVLFLCKNRLGEV